MWLQVARYGRCFRGEPLTGAVDPERVRRYNLDNLRSYWQGEAVWVRGGLAERDPASTIDAGRRPGSCSGRHGRITRWPPATW
jgi:hypothetical protein